MQGTPLTDEEREIRRRHQEEEDRENDVKRFQIADDSYELHFTGNSIWLNTDVADFDGICVGAGSSRLEALADAIATLEAALVVLRKESA